MALTDIAKQIEKYAVDNSPSILTGIAVVGTVTTAVLAGRAGYVVGFMVATDEALVAVNQEDRKPLRAFDVAKEYWSDFIPPVASGVLTVVSIIGANRIGSRRAAALAAAYSLSEKAYQEYKDKVVQTIGEKKNQKVYDEIAQEKVTNDPYKSSEVVITGNGDVMCYDTITGRYFMSSMEGIRSAQNTINKQILDCDYASLTEFFDQLGLKGTSYSEEVGWTTQNMLDVFFSTVMSEDGKPCIAIQYTTAPVRNYYKVQ